MRWSRRLRSAAVRRTGRSYRLSDCGVEPGDSPPVTVTKMGSGTVAGGKINFGGSCTEQVAAGHCHPDGEHSRKRGFRRMVGRLRNPASTCSLVVNGPVTVNAGFIPVFTLSVGRRGGGTVAGTPEGSFGTSINCGGSCSAKFEVNTAVTLTTTPLAGHTYVNWTARARVLRRRAW